MNFDQSVGTSPTLDLGHALEVLCVQRLTPFSARQPRRPSHPPLPLARPGRRPGDALHSIADLQLQVLSPQRGRAVILRPAPRPCSRSVTVSTALSVPSTMEARIRRKMGHSRMSGCLYVSVLATSRTSFRWASDSVRPPSRHRSLRFSPRQYDNRKHQGGQHHHVGPVQPVHHSSPPL